MAQTIYNYKSPSSNVRFSFTPKFLDFLAVYFLNRRENSHFTLKTQKNRGKLFFRGNHDQLWFTRLPYHYLTLPPLKQYRFLELWKFSGVLAWLLLDSNLKKWHSPFFFSNHTDNNKCNFSSFRGNKLNKFTHTYNAIKQVWAKFQLISRNFKWVTMLWIAKSHFFFAAGNQTRLQITIKLAISDQCGWKFIPECKTARIIARYVFFCITLHILGGF